MMRKVHKISLASLGVMVGISAGILTMVEKSISIVRALKPEASISDNKDTQRGLPVDRIEPKQGKIIARGVE
jgi:hypothetical protein